MGSSPTLPQCSDYESSRRKPTFIVTWKCAMAPSAVGRRIHRTSRSREPGAHHVVAATGLLGPPGAVVAALG